LLLVVGAVLFLYATSCGLGITYDSRQYLAAARSLLQNGTLRTADGTAYAHWPPLYPAWLAVWGAAETVKYAHLAVWLVTLSFAQRFGQKMLKTPFAQTFFLLTLVFGTPLFLVQVFAWSEGLFVLLTVLVFVFFRKFTETERKRHLFWMLLFSNLLCLQRLTGMFFVAGFGLLLWQARQNAKLTLMYVSVSLTSVTLWMLRNTCVETEPSFVGDLFVVSPLVSVKNHLSAIGNWFVPQAVPVAAKAAIVLSVGLALAFCGWRAEPLSCGKRRFWESSIWVPQCWLLASRAKPTGLWHRATCGWRPPFASLPISGWAFCKSNGNAGQPWDCWRFGFFIR
jgi:hypothetical protein